jgi:hypothetical protein
MTITATTQTGKKFTADTIREATHSAGAALHPVSVTCDQCSIAVINGHVCHETGCPNAWRDEVRNCKWCGQDFKPEERHQTCCSPCCATTYAGGVCECEHCRSAEPQEVSDAG